MKNKHWLPYRAKRSEGTAIVSFSLPAHLLEAWENLRREQEPGGSRSKCIAAMIQEDYDRRRAAA